MTDPIPERDVTPESDYRGRREFLKGAGLFAAGASVVGGGLWALMARRSTAFTTPTVAPPAPEPLPVKPAPRGAGLHDTDEPQTSFQDATTYNNFYELGTGKDDPARNAHQLVTKPWTVEIAGHVKKPGTIDMEALLGWFPLEERIYRMRCVEAWSMVIPWLGFPLHALLNRVEPTDRAKYVAFHTIHDPQMLPGQRRPVLDWPYVEGLRLDEAMHPLTFLSVGIYGKTLPAQNGAPIRLVVPWKYGFKGGKSIVRIELTEQRPATSWNIAAPHEYGFYANVNPEVDHPRWSQATERRIGDLARRPTLPFNGYAKQVAHLYEGLDLRTNF